MRTKILRKIALLSAGFVALSAACDSGDDSTSAAGATAATTGNAIPTPATADASHGRSLTVSFDPSIDGDDDDVKATTFTSADGGAADDAYAECRSRGKRAV